MGDYSSISRFFKPEEAPNDLIRIEALKNLRLANEPVKPSGISEEVELDNSNQSSLPKGLDIIKAHEGLRLTPYKDPVGKLTVGYGHTGEDVTPDMQITENDAEEMLQGKVGALEQSLRQVVKVPVSNEQFSALVSLGYNIGFNNLKNSTLMNKLNQGDYDGAAEEFSRWDKAGGKTLPGLAKRRDEEKDLFLNRIASNE